MATDSIQLSNDSFIQRIHGSGKQWGKLHKGHSITAASASIPSKYQTIVINNAERKGFLSRSKRFPGLDVNDKPAPGTYLGLNKVDKVTPSLSKKGTGGFASRDRRLKNNSATAGPGAGSYALPSHTVSRKDFNRSNATSNFHQPIAQNVEEKKFKTPGPGRYEVLVSSKNVGKRTGLGAETAFKSKSKRETFDLTAKANPAPGHYQINEKLTKPNITGPISSFKSTTARQMAADPDPVPGPGAYKPYEGVDPIDKTLFPKKHYLCISAPAMPLPKPGPAPGPGAYELVDFEGPARHYMSGSVFVSSTSRWTSSQPRDRENPGPAHYRPGETGKQSFIYNSAGRWI